MKYYARIESEKGKQVGTGGNEYLDIDIMVGNVRLAAFTVREGECPDGTNGTILVDEDDATVGWLSDKVKGK